MWPTSPSTSYRAPSTRGWAPLESRGGRDGLRARTLRLVLGRRSAKAGLVLIGFVLALAFYGVALDPYPPMAFPCYATCAGIPPFVNLFHPFGTFPGGQDVFSEVAHGAPFDFSVSLGATAVALVIGLFVGLLAGYFRGAAHNLLLSAIQVTLLLPSFLILVFFYTTHGDVNLFVNPPQIGEFMVVLGAFSWPPIALVVRNSVMALKGEDFITSARSLGAGARHILLRHVIPNVVGAAASVVSIVFAANITAESLLVFLGLVPNLEHQELVTTWGFLLWQGSNNLIGYWWISFFPGLMIAISVLGFSLLGDAVYEAMSPKLRVVPG